MVELGNAVGERLTTTDGVDLPTQQFRAFFAELRHAIGLVRSAGGTDATAVAAAVSKRIIEIIELQSLESRRLGGQAAVETEGHARYLKAALADEWMLNADWEGRSAWRHVLIEATMFGSSIAGDKIFDDIDALLAAREPSQRQTARLYLHVLSLGFQGRHRGSGNLDVLASYRAELFQFIYLRNPSLGDRGRVLTAQAYDSTLSHLTARRLPRLNRWVVVFVLALLLMLGVSELLWLWQSWPVRQVIEPSVLQSLVIPLDGASLC